MGINSIDGVKNNNINIVTNANNWKVQIRLQIRVIVRSLTISNRKKNVTIIVKLEKNVRGCVDKFNFNYIKFV